MTNLSYIVRASRGSIAPVRQQVSVADMELIDKYVVDKGYKDVLSYLMENFKSIPFTMSLRDKYDIIIRAAIAEGY